MRVRCAHCGVRGKRAFEKKLSAENHRSCRMRNSTLARSSF